MRIVVFSLGPVFRDHVHGGSQKILADVVRHLGEAGHTVNVLCTSRPDNATVFPLGPNVRISPSLGFKATYPEPYYVPPFRLANVIEQVRRALDDADVFYIHDGELLYHFLYSDIPTVVSLRDFVYPDTLAGAMSFRRDALILSSDYLAGCVIDAFSGFCPGVSDRISVIRNGIDLRTFRPGQADELRNLIPLPRDAIVILYPHRPDPRKGIFESLEVLATLRRRLVRTRRPLRLLIPVWMDGALTTESDHVYQTVYDHVRERSRRLGVDDLLVFHPWVPLSLMPAYYALGAVTLCIGSFVEAFGNVSLESAACGTRPVVSRVAAHRTVLPDAVSTKVPPLDVIAVVDAIEEALHHPYPVDAVREILAADYSYGSMLHSYETVITTARVTPAVPEVYRFAVADDDVLQTPTWCSYEVDGGYYNDYLYSYSHDPTIVRLAVERMLPSTVRQLVSRGVLRSDLTRLLDEGALVRRIAPPSPKEAVVK